MKMTEEKTLLEAHKLYTMKSDPVYSDTTKKNFDDRLKFQQIGGVLKKVSKIKDPNAIIRLGIAWSDTDSMKSFYKNYLDVTGIYLKNLYTLDIGRKLEKDIPGLIKVFEKSHMVTAFLNVNGELVGVGHFVSSKGPGDVLNLFNGIRYVKNSRIEMRAFNESADLPQSITINEDNTINYVPSLGMIFNELLESEESAPNSFESYIKEIKEKADKSNKPSIAVRNVTDKEKEFYKKQDKLDSFVVTLNPLKSGELDKGSLVKVTITDDKTNKIEYAKTVHSLKSLEDFKKALSSSNELKKD